MLERPTWEWWRRGITEAACLTSAGQATVLEAAGAIEDFLGPNWLDRSLSRGAPLLDLDLFPGNKIPAVYARLLDISAHLTLLQPAKGMGRLRKMLQSNPQTINWRHGLLQLEVAGLALREGWEVEFEPRHRTRGAADVLLADGTGRQLVVETVVMGTDLRYRLMSRALDALREIEMRYDVSFSGNTGDIDFRDSDLEGSAERWVEAWSSVLIEAAARVAASKIALPAKGPTDGQLWISPGFASRQGTLTGPDVNSQVTSRIQARIADKARAGGDFDRLWIRLDDVGPLFYLTQWAGASLSEKLRSLEPVVTSILQPYPNVAGLILSNGWAWRMPGILEERHSTGAMSIAIRRVIAIQCYRETFVKARDNQSINDVAQIGRWYSNEASWLEWALKVLKLPPLSELIRET
jgi:hypothetical protein